MSDDKTLERVRYDSRAELQIIQEAILEDIPLGSQAIPPYMRAPYYYYELKLKELICPGKRVLELASGAGMHTRALLQTGAEVTASDLSPNSLNLLQQRFRRIPGKLELVVADMENLPFDARSFDVVTSAGSLSYGDPYLVDSEIRRVLRPGGMLICVDSLNHNPVYRANRWLHYMRGNRSKSTLKRMPDLARIRGLGEGFSSVSVRFFGAISYAMPVVARLFGENTACIASDRIDQLVGVRRSAFKFVVVAQGFA